MDQVTGGCPCGAMRIEASGEPRRVPLGPRCCKLGLDWRKQLSLS